MAYAPVHCHSLSNTSFLQLAHACAASHIPLVKVMKLKPFERWNMSFLSHLIAASMTPDFPLNTHPSADETHSTCPNFDFDLITKSPQMMSWWGRSQHDVMIGRILIGSHCRFISSLECTWIYMTFCDFPWINLTFGKSPGFLGGQKWGSRSCRCFGSELQEYHLLQLQLGHADLQMARGIGEIAAGPLSDCLLVALKGWGCGSAHCPWLAMWIFDSCCDRQIFWCDNPTDEHGCSRRMYFVSFGGVKKWFSKARLYSQKVAPWKTIANRSSDTWDYLGHFVEENPSLNCLVSMFFSKYDHSICGTCKP